MGLKTAPAAGTKVRLTGKFLAQTGQQRGSEGMGRWTVIECKQGLRPADNRIAPRKAGDWTSTDGPCDLCVGGTHCATNEKLDLSVGYEDLTPEQRAVRTRHFALGNLEIVGAPPKAEDYDIPHR